MNIKSMLLRLQGALDRDDLSHELLLLPGLSSAPADWAQTEQVINLVVGYNGSPKSHTALDLTLWVAHQTRLATQKQVTVEVVYVVDPSQSQHCPDRFSLSDMSTARPFYETAPQLKLNFGSSAAAASAQSSSLATSTLTAPAELHISTQSVYQIDPFEQADQILWQARHLADEWRGSLKAHLRFGAVSTELRKIVASEAAAVLFLGCHSKTHPIVQELGNAFPCPVLGIPTAAS